MKAKITLKNGEEVWTDNIKCPVCQNKMVYDAKESSVPTKVETYITDLHPPFHGIQTRQTRYYKSIFRCPIQCCSIELEHIVDDLII